MNKIQIPENKVSDSEINTFVLAYPKELLDAYEEYGYGIVSFNKWVKTVSKYTTFHYETNSYYAVVKYYTSKDNIVATVTSRKFKI
jgi:hypothetical protein